MSAIVVAVGKQMTGITFQLHPRTKAWLESRLPDWSPAAKSVFVSFDTQRDFERMHGPMWTQIVMLLTGLNEDKLRDLGGFTFISPADEEVIYESHAA